MPARRCAFQNLPTRKPRRALVRSDAPMHTKPRSSAAEATQAPGGSTIANEESLPPSTVVESLPPSTMVESLPPSAVVESLPPSAVVESLPPSTVVESLPPSSTMEEAHMPDAPFSERPTQTEEVTYRTAGTQAQGIDPNHQASRTLVRKLR